MNKKLYFDIDGVVGDLVAAILRYRPETRIRNPYVYNISRMFSNLPDSIVLNDWLYHPINFQPYPHVAPVLENLVSNGYDISFVSARPDITELATRSTLSVFGMADAELRLGLSTPTQKLIHIIRDMRKNHIEKAWIVEDNPSFIAYIAGAYRNHKVIRETLHTLMYMQPYNQSEQNTCAMWPEQFTPVMNWRHILSEVTNESS